MAHPFHSNRLVFRAIEDNDEDKAFIHSLRTDTEFNALFSHELLKPLDKKSSDAWTEGIRTNAFISVLACLSTTNLDEGSSATATLKPIGIVYLHKIEESIRHHRDADIAVYIGSKHQRRGYGSEALDWIVGWAFKHAGLHRVGLDVFSYNVGACRMYERLGFTLEGRKRECLWYHGGWHDMLSFGMLEGEWQAKVRPSKREHENNSEA